jgi:hypothetical protein
MKLFEEINRTVDEFILEYQDGNRTVERYEYINLTLVPETVDYLLNKSGGSTLNRIRALIANLYNCNYYPAPDLFRMMRNADDEHAELIVNIIESCSLKHRDSCFLMINDLAPKLIDHFGLDEQEE